ncbi:hypothetical protein, partial [Kitasatospora kifunensis]
RRSLRRLVVARLGVLVRRALESRVGRIARQATVWLGDQVVTAVRSKMCWAIYAAAFGGDLLIEPDHAWWLVHSNRPPILLILLAIAGWDGYQWWRQRGDDDGWIWIPGGRPPGGGWWPPEPDDGPDDDGIYEPADANWAAWEQELAWARVRAPKSGERR